MQELKDVFKKWPLCQSVRGCLDGGINSFKWRSWGFVCLSKWQLLYAAMGAARGRLQLRSFCVGGERERV